MNPQPTPKPVLEDGGPNKMKSIINIPHVTTIHFFNFANGSAPKAVPVKGYVTLDVIAKAAKKNCGLCSRAIDVTFDENADLNAAVTGTVYAGIRAVGRFRIIGPNVN